MSHGADPDHNVTNLSRPAGWGEPLAGVVPQDVPPFAFFHNGLDTCTFLGCGSASPPGRWLFFPFGLGACCSSGRRTASGADADQIPISQSRLYQHGRSAGLWRRSMPTNGGATGRWQPARSKGARQFTLVDLFLQGKPGAKRILFLADQDALRGSRRCKTASRRSYRTKARVGASLGARDLSKRGCMWQRCKP